MQKMISFLSGAVMGALVGATIAVLVAPAPGETIRSDLQNRVQTLRDEMQEAASNRRTELYSELERLRKPEILRQ
jgi:gas vesicle protein